MRKLMLSAMLALVVLGSAVVPAAEARPWRRWYPGAYYYSAPYYGYYGGGYFGSYYGPGYYMPGWRW